MLAWVVPLLFGYDATLDDRAAAPAPGASAVRELAAADGIVVDGADGVGGSSTHEDGDQAATGGADRGPAFLGLDNDRNVAQARSSAAGVAC